jgi:hypothetical protein
MANTKISALTSATTPLAGTETLPIVQSSTTKQVSIANVTAGRSVSAADYVMSTGNLVPSTAAKGVNFTANTPAAGKTSQLLNWYEEGTWTPNDSSGAGLSLTVTSATYTRIGRMVYAYFNITYPTTVNGSSVIIGGLPFPSTVNGPVCIAYTTYGSSIIGQTGAASDTTFFLYTAAAVNLINAGLSGKVIRATVIYNT